MAEQPTNDDKEQPLFTNRMVERKEIRDLKPKEKERFFKAIDTMMKNKVDENDETKTIPGSSDFFRLAGYHGVPSDYCHHSRETFPGWHRIYLFEFEQALQAADKLNGYDPQKDGYLYLPYWDWTNTPMNDDNTSQHPLSTVILGWENDPAIKGWANFKDFFPANFWENDILNRKNWRGQTFWDRYRLNKEECQKAVLRNSDNQIARNIHGWRIIRDANQCLLATQHYVHASGYDTTSIGNIEYNSLELPHGSIHGAIGGYMGTPELAAFDIIFWLHHCNVDRIYEAYLKYETNKQNGEVDPIYEFENNQQAQTKNLFVQPFVPFEKPKKNDSDKTEYFLPADTFSTAPLGYKYDKLPEKLSQSEINRMLREPPTIVMFENVKISDFGSACYMIHVLIYDKTKMNGDDEKENKINGADDIDYTSDHYAGGIYIFGRSGADCQNCAQTPPQNMAVDITDTIKKLGISRYNATPKVYLQQTMNPLNKQLKTINDDDIPLTAPIITGPLFEKKTDSLSTKNRANNDKNEVGSLQKYLQRYGYYGKERKIDGDYGEFTERAVKEFQKALGLKADGEGVAGPETLKAMESTKRCSNKDVDDEIDLNTATYKEKKQLSYTIGVIPGYLKKNQVSQCIGKVCKQYTDATDGLLSFKEIDSSDDDEKIDIKFDFVVFKSNDDKIRDGPGGILGYGGIGFVQFDLAERWVIGDNNDDEKELSDIFDINTWRNGQPVISLYYTALHELGHCLGLKHSGNSDDVMSPWYNPTQKELTKNDKEQLKNTIQIK